MKIQYIDKITKGGNEDWLNERYNQSSKQSGQDFALISLDIKRFKYLDRIYGREASNHFLLKIYQAILSCLDEEESVARIYANYFNVLIKYEKSDILVKRVLKIDSAIYNIEEAEIYHKIYTGF